jgi:adenylate cyclase
MRIDLRSPHLALTVATILLAAIAAVLLGFWHLDGRGSIINRLEAWLLDWRFEMVGPRPAPENVLIVAIDDETVRRAGAYPLPRATLGRLVRTLIEGGAQVVAIDLLFLDRGAGDADAELASAFSTGRVVIAAAALFGAGEAVTDTQVGPDRSVALPSANRVLLPISTLASAAAAGVVNIATDHSGTPQYIPLLIRSGQELFPSFVLRAAALATQAEPQLGADAVDLGNTRSSLDLGFHLPIRFYGKRGTVRTISAARVLERGIGDAARGRTIVIGVTAVGAADTFATPFDPILPGVEVLSTGIGHLTTGHGLTRNLATRRIDAASALCLPIATILLLSLPQIGVGIILAIGLMLLWGVCAVVAFYYDYWLTMALPLVTAVPAALGYGAVRLWLEQRIERRLEIQQKALRRFHHPALVEKLIAAPDFLEEPVQQHAAVLFIDLSGFTGLSEQLGA